MIVLEKMPYRLKHTAICIGKFDGLHSGHRLLTDSIRKYKDKTKVLFTFSFSDTKSLYSAKEKRYLAEKLGMDIYIDCPFDEKFARMSPDAFLKEILLDECGAEVISVGEDFRFGYRRSGDVEFLRNRSIRDGFELNIFSKKRMFGEEVSSTRIRKLLVDGEMEIVGKLLGQPYFIYETVCCGNRIGRTELNMPTANQVLPPGKLLPPFGVYASQVRTEDGVYAGVTNIGIKPTIPGENRAGAETHIIGFDGNLYGKDICVELCAHLRREQKFSGLPALREQMEKDREQSRTFFQEHAADLESR